MQIENVFEQPLLIEDDTSVSKAAARMLESRSYEALVMHGHDFLGVLSAYDLAKANISNPEKRTIRHFIKQANPIQAYSDPEDVLNAMLVNGHRSLPVQKEDETYIVTKLGLLNYFRDKLDLHGKTAADVMSFPFCVSLDDSMSTARAIIRDMGVSGVVVLDENDKVYGVVDSLQLLRSVMGKTRASRGEENGEKIHLDDIPVKSIASNEYVRVNVDAPLGDVYAKILDKNAYNIIVEENGRLAGLVTPKDILKLISVAVEGVRVTVSGLHEEDHFIKDMVNEEITHTIQRLSKSVYLSYFVVHARKYHKSGRRVKYSLHARLITGKGDFFADDYAWDLTKATRGLLAKLEKEVHKRLEKARAYDRTQ